jgi:hypothetical protein
LLVDGEELLVDREGVDRESVDREGLLVEEFLIKREKCLIY